MDFSLLLPYTNLLLVSLFAAIAVLTLFYYFFKKQKYAFEIKLLRQRLENGDEVLKNQLADLKEVEEAVTLQLSALKAQNETLRQENQEISALLTEKTIENRGIEPLLEENKQLEKRLEFVKTEFDKAILELEKTRLKSQKEEQIYHEKLALLDRNKEQVKLEFEKLANQIFDAKTKTLSEQNQSNLTQLVEPIKTKFKDFTQLIHDTYEKETQERSSLKQELKQLQELNQQLNSQAHALTNALSGKNYKIQGNWGEMILEKILESSGLRKDRDYTLQKQFSRREAGDPEVKLQPDAIINLPDNKHIIIDAKVSLNDYVKLINAEDEAERKKHLKNLTIDIKNHIKNLAKKEYFSLPDTHSLDFVLMFIPTEPAYLTVLQADEGLLQYAFEQQIMLVGPSTLLAMLKTISNIWRFENQTENAVKIAEEGGKLYDKFVSFIAKFDEIGKNLHRAQSHFEDARKNLTSGRGNIVAKMEHLKKMGIATNKKIDKSYLKKEEIKEEYKEKSREESKEEAAVHLSSFTHQLEALKAKMANDVDKESQ